METKPSRHITLADVAHAAGLSHAGTSYALRGHPSIPEQTVARVRQLADSLGYKPDLRIQSLMASIRQRHIARRPEPLAFVWLRTPREIERLPPHLSHFATAVRTGAQRRAAELGCSLEEFWLDVGEPTPRQLNRILRARGITGCVFTTAASNEPIALDWNWTNFAAAIIGHTEFSPPLHRAAHHHYLGMCAALRRLQAEGFRRPAAVLSRSVQNRTHHMQAGAFLANHPAPALAPELVRICLPEDFAALPPWSAALAPDALIVGWQVDRATADLLHSRCPTARKLVTLDWYPYGVLPGVDPVNYEIAASAIDLVVEQLHNNSRGLPARAATSLIEGVWRENT